MEVRPITTIIATSPLKHSVTVSLYGLKAKPDSIIKSEGQLPAVSRTKQREIGLGKSVNKVIKGLSSIASQLERKNIVRPPIQKKGKARKNIKYPHIG